MAGEKANRLIIYLIFLLFVFQCPLEGEIGVTSYIDESVILLSAYLVVAKRNYVKILLKKRENKQFLLLIAMFVCFGLVGNFLYRYQTLPLVAQDIIANTKFYFAILSGYLIFDPGMFERHEKQLNRFVTRVSYFLFFIFILDRVFNIFGGSVRYGIRSARLFYLHTTHLAAAMAFLLAVLAATYTPKSKIPIIMDLIILTVTLRSKAIMSAAAFVFLFWHILVRGKKLHLWQVALLACLGIFVGWGQIKYYFVTLSATAARSIMTRTGFEIMRDYFPFGTGFGTFASHSAAVNYSPVYVKYGFDYMWEVSSRNPHAFFNDTFWPIICGQTGVLGLSTYLLIILNLFKNCTLLEKKSGEKYMAALFILVYMGISSMAESAFNNSLGIPLGFLFGMLMCVKEDRR